MRRFRWIVSYSSVAGTHFQLFRTCRAARARVAELRGYGYTPRIIDGKTGCVYGQQPLSIPPSKKAA